MKIAMKDAGNVIAVGIVEPQDGYDPIMLLGTPVLKNLIKMMSAYGSEEYELGTLTNSQGEKVLVLKPTDAPQGVNAGFLVAGRVDMSPPPAKAVKAMADPDQTKIPGVTS